ncbi:unnamed protein product [Medioppia subpectinata]|uniref:Insulin-like domain-containing protein n=1 Tax=Medioppia subpectinata TaxID=1979941 RepID=A0A7R9KNX1_9ACAR|nr:unnamed protein product [Medioppia subpectinata]CAG2107040.1 unnamed protein product [Medioppia subpectinata]
MAKYLAITIALVAIMSDVVPVLSMPGAAHSKLYKHVIRSRSTPRRYCGRNLVNMLSLLCDGISELWADLNGATDSLGSAVGDDHDYSAGDISPLLSNKYFLDEKTALDMFNDAAGGQTEREGAVRNNRFARNRRGIVDECCRKPCTVKELYSYCE